MRDHPSKTRWEAENVLVARVKVNRNQDPELYQYLKETESQSKATRELLRLGLEAKKQQGK